jgi:hypothetical protein
MESRLLHEIIDEGFEAVAQFLGFNSELLASVRERIEHGVTGNGPLDPDDALVLRWLANEWGGRLMLLRARSEQGYTAANEPVMRLVTLVRIALSVRGGKDPEGVSASLSMPPATEKETRPEPS